jgi:hypothetical protein
MMDAILAFLSVYVSENSKIANTNLGHKHKDSTAASSRVTIGSSDLGRFRSNGRPGLKSKNSNFWVEAEAAWADC